MHAPVVLCLVPFIYVSPCLPKLDHDLTVRTALLGRPIPLLSLVQAHLSPASREQHVHEEATAPAPLRSHALHARMGTMPLTQAHQSATGSTPSVFPPSLFLSPRRSLLPPYSVHLFSVRCRVAPSGNHSTLPRTPLM